MMSATATNTTMIGDVVNDTDSEKSFIPRKKPLSRRATGYTKPTRSPMDKAREQYFKERERREKCRKSNPGVEACKSCPNEHRCPQEATEDWINAEKAK